LKAALFHEDHTITVEDVPIPVAGAGEALLRVLECGVCGTDLRIQAGEFLARGYPVRAGHEIAGRVEAVGEGVAKVRVGDLVGVNPNAGCGACYWCLRGRPHLCPDMKAVSLDSPGGFAEYMTAPEAQTLVMPAGATVDAAAMLEPTSCCLHGIDVAEIMPGDPTVILGGGSIGLILLQLARHAGSAPMVVVEPREEKRALAMELGADAVIDPNGLDEVALRAKVDELTDGGAQVVIEASGNGRAAAAAMGLARRGATVLFFGVQDPALELPLKPFDIYHHEITIRGAFTNPLTDTRARAMLATGRVKVEKLISHRYALDDISAALDAVRKGETVKAMIVFEAAGGLLGGLR
jgi:L-iditol 2-dehydrogenase